MKFVNNKNIFLKSKHYQLAFLLTQKLLKYHKSKIVAVGVFGSIATSTNTYYSDVDLIIITKKKSKDKFFILQNGKTRILPEIGKDIKISLFFKTKRESMNILRSINDLFWPVKSAMLLNVFPIYDPQDMFAEFRAVFKKFKGKCHDKKFQRLAGQWLSVAYEFLGKIHKQNLNKKQALIYTKEFIFCIANAYKAINKDFFKNIYNFIDETKELSIKHGGVTNLMELLLNLRDISSIRRNAMKLWKDTNYYMQSHCVQMVSYSRSQLNDVLKELLS